MVTGGYEKSTQDVALKTVTKYSKNGENETLPQLNVRRYNHACGSYLTDEGDLVRFIIKYQ